MKRGTKHGALATRDNLNYLVAGWSSSLAPQAASAPTECCSAGCASPALGVAPPAGALAAAVASAVPGAVETGGPPGAAFGGGTNDCSFPITVLLSSAN